jgi:hypothetical protein
MAGAAWIAATPLTLAGLGQPPRLT